MPTNGSSSAAAAATKRLLEAKPCHSKQNPIVLTTPRHRYLLHTEIASTARNAATNVHIHSASSPQPSPSSKRKTRCSIDTPVPQHPQSAHGQQPRTALCHRGARATTDGDSIHTVPPHGSPLQPQLPFHDVLHAAARIGVLLGCRIDLVHNLSSGSSHVQHYPNASKNHAPTNAR